MIRRLLGPIPIWAQADFPLLRYELNRNRNQPTMRAHIIRIIGIALALALLIFIGLLWATNGLLEPAGGNMADSIWRTLFYPVFALQVVSSITAISLGVDAIGTLRRRQRWDNIRATEHGASYTLRAHWVAILYRLRGAFYLLFTARVVLIGVILYQLTSHRGGFLDILTGNITPEVPLVAGILLVAAAMTAAFLLPLTTIGLDAALGLLISTIFKNRAFAHVAQTIAIAGRLILSIGLLVLVTAYMQNTLTIEADSLEWLTVGAYSAFSDWGILLMNLDQAGELWAIIDYGVFFGLALLVAVLAQAILIDGVLQYSVRRAECMSE